MFLVMFPEVDEKYEIVVCVVHVHVHSKVVYYCNISIAEPISHSYLIPNLTTNSNNSCQPHFLFPPNTNLLNFNRGPAPPSALSFRQPINCIHYLTPSPSNCAHFNLDSHPTDSWSAHEVARKEGPHHISHSKNTPRFTPRPPLSLSSPDPRKSQKSHYEHSHNSRSLSHEMPSAMPPPKSVANTAIADTRRTSTAWSPQGEFMFPASRTRPSSKVNGVGVQVEDTRICVVMVGLPARGKSLIAQKGKRQSPTAYILRGISR
jgi:hypothetical protein